MKRLLFVFVLVVLGSRLADGQGACAQLGVDCSHPNIEQRPSTPPCDQACRALARERNDEYWKRREEARKELDDERQKRDEQRAAAKAAREEAKRIAQANKIAAEAWTEMQKEDCAKAVDLYGQALKLATFLPWSENQATCMVTLRRFDAAYAQWERLINDRRTPDSEIRGMRLEEWNIMFDKGYICPVPPFFNGTAGCYRRPDHKTLDRIYVPLPYIKGDTWTPQQVISSGPFTVTTRDGRVWHSGEVNMTTLNLMNARIQTGKGTVVRFLLPDDTTFALGPESDMTVDNFVYDPNESLSTMTVNAVEGMLRFVSGRLAHPTPASKIILLPTGSLLRNEKPGRVWSRSELNRACQKGGEAPCVMAVGIRGTDVEINHDPNGKATMNEGSDRWWVCAYDGEVHVTGDTDYPVPVGQCFRKVAHAAGWPVAANNDHANMYVFENYDNRPGAGAAAIQHNADLSVTDSWDQVIAPPIVGRQGVGPNPNRR